MSHVQVARPPLTSEEDAFCLAVVEYGGNLPAAYRAVFVNEDEEKPKSRTAYLMAAHELVSRPEVALRIKELNTVVNDHALVSLGSHLMELADIRDLAKHTGQLKVALGAETKRGEAAGFYSKKVEEPLASRQPQVIINLPSSPANIQDWARQRGTEAVIIDLESGK